MNFYLSSSKNEKSVPDMSYIQRPTRKSPLYSNYEFSIKIPILKYEALTQDSKFQLETLILMNVFTLRHKLLEYYAFYRFRLLCQVKLCFLQLGYFSFRYCYT